MIIDHIDNVSFYYGLGDRIVKALEFLKNNDFSNMECGTYEIDGSNVYAMVKRYESKPIEKGLWEAHRKYIDVQYVVEGEEKIGYSNLSSMQEVQEYNPEKDFLELKGTGDFFVLEKGKFAIFTPQDVHMPEIASHSTKNVTKVVIKVLID